MEGNHKNISNIYLEGGGINGKNIKNTLMQI
jgi:hypothetical protein